MTQPHNPTIEKLQPGDPDTQSADVVTENIARLKALFPELVTEGKDGASVNIDVLKQLLGDATVSDCDEKFGLNWHGKRRARQLALTPSTGTLRPCPEDSLDWDTTQNLFIEGDNLEVLKVLQKSLARSVKAIYVDPPYNTGKDYVYRDNYRNPIQHYKKLTGQIADEGEKLVSNAESSGRFHTAWLNMIYPRLKLARELLREDGVIFVSIADDEAANLRLVLDDIFGSENFLDTLCVEMSTTSGPKTVNAQQGTIVKNTEFSHVYRKSAEFDSARKTPLLDGIQTFDTHYSMWLNDDGTLSALADAMMRDDAVRADIEKYQLAGRSGFSINSMDRLLALSETASAFINDNLDKIARIDRPPVSLDGESTEVGTWRKCEAEHRQYFITTLRNGTLQALMPLSLNYRMSDDYKPRFGRTVIRGDLWKGFHQDMGNVAKEGGIAFDNGKKPVRLISQMIKWSNAENDGIYLDFFAGSGTTGHAVMAQNAKDGGSRRFILVQLPEPLDAANKDQKAAAMLCDELEVPRTLAELTKERLRRAAGQIASESPMFAGDVGFRVFKLDSSNIREWEPNREDIAESLEAHVENLRTKRTEQDILYELLLKRGLDLCVPIETKQIAGKTVHSIGAGTLFACLSESITPDEGEPLALGIVAWHQELDPAGDTTVVFRDSAFADDVVKTNVAAILDQSGLKNVRSL